MPGFVYDDYDINALTPERRRELVEAVTRGDAYLTGGRSAELRGTGGADRTPAGPETIRNGRATLSSEQRGAAGRTDGPPEAPSRDARG